MTHFDLVKFCGAISISGWSKGKRSFKLHHNRVKHFKTETLGQSITSKSNPVFQNQNLHLDNEAPKTEKLGRDTEQRAAGEGTPKRELQSSTRPTTRTILVRSVRHHGNLKKCTTRIHQCWNDAFVNNNTPKKQLKSNPTTHHPQRTTRPSIQFQTQQKIMKQNDVNQTKTEIAQTK